MQILLKYLRKCIAYELLAARGNKGERTLHSPPWIADHQDCQPNPHRRRLKANQKEQNRVEDHTTPYDEYSAKCASQLTSESPEANEGTDRRGSPHKIYLAW